MAARWSVSLAAVLLVLAARTAHGAQDLKFAKIVGGIYAKPNQIPYQVYVRTFTNKVVDFCGGAIISRWHVLTAAHCVNMPKVKKVMAVVGDVDKTSDMAIRLNVAKIYYFKRKSNKIDNDIAILKMSSPFPTHLPNVKAIKLQKKQGYTSKKCVVSGWGDTFDSSDEDLLKVVHLPIVERKKCAKVYPYDGPDDLLCAGYNKGGKDTCQGDSGGPLVCDGLLTGLVKAGIGCALPKFPGTYTEVAYYYPWIKKVIAGAESDSTHTNSVFSFYYQSKNNRRGRGRIV